MATLTNTQISVTYVGLLKTSASTVLSSTAQQITDGSGNNSVLFLSTAGVGIGGAPSSGIEFEVTGNAKITGDLIVDNLTFDGSGITSSGALELDSASANDITLDSGGDIILDADGADVLLKDAGTHFGSITNSSTDLVISSIVADKDIIFKGLDDSSNITALTLDMSDAGKALFNSGATFGGLITSNSGIVIDNITIDGTEIDLSSGDLTLDVAGDIILDAGGGDINLKDDGTDFGAFTNSSGNLIIKSGTTTMLTGSGANATFAGNVGIGVTPVAKLHVSGDSGGTDSIARFQNTNSAKVTRIQLSDNAGTVGDVLIAYDHSDASSANHFVGMGVNNNTAFKIDNNDNITLGAATSLAFDVSDFAQITFKESGAITIDSDNNQSSRNFQIKDGSGTSLLYVGDDGLVGIGTATPARPLSVNSSQISARFTSSSADSQIEIADSSGTVVFGSSSGNAIIQAGSAERMRISSAGVVKIEGSENTLLRLISTDANVFLELKDNNSTNGNFIGTIGDTMPFYTNNTLALTIDASQNVGIGTSSPTDVNALHLKSAFDTDFPTLKIETSSATRDASLSFITNGGNTFCMGIDASDSDKFKISDNSILGTNDRFVINSDGIVGMGATGIYTSGATAQLNLPSYALAIKNNVSGSNNNWSYIRNTGTGSDANIEFTTGVGISLTLNHDKSATFETDVAIGTSTASSVRAFIKGKDDSSSNFQILTRNSSDENIFAVNNAGNCGIFTSTPLKRLDVVFNSTGSRRLLSSFDDSIITLHAANASANPETFRIVGDNIRFNTGSSGTGSEAYRILNDGVIQIGGTTNAGFIDFDGTSLQLNTQRNPNTGTFVNTSKSHASLVMSGGDADSNIKFYTNDANNSTANERMRINKSGDILFGTTSETNTHSYFSAESNSRMVLSLGSSTTASQVLVAFKDSTNGTIGNVTSNAGGVSFNSISDYRLKENIVEMTNALDRVSQLKPSQYNLKKHKDNTVEGFIAHELQSVYPQAVSGVKDAVNDKGEPEYQFVDNSKLVPLLVGAIQELKKEIEILKNK